MVVYIRRVLKENQQKMRLIIYYIIMPIAQKVYQLPQFQYMI